jgi:hypothetical protein
LGRIRKKSCWYIGFKKEVSICKEGGECRTLQPDEYKYNKEKCEFEVALAPGESIEVDLESGGGTVKETVERFNQRLYAIELKIKTPGGLIRYEGFEVLNAFKKKDKTKYVLEYR